MTLINFNQKYLKPFGFIFPAILIVFLIRLLFSFLPGFSHDMGTWFSWANRLSTLGFGQFYSETTWTQYTPGFFYWLWVVGKMNWFSELAIKIPAILADIATGFLIYSLVKKVDKKLAAVSFVVYTLNPVLIFNGSVWGQIDGILTLFLFLSIYFLIEKKNLIITAIFWSIAFLIKPQSLAIAPVIAFIAILKRYSIKDILFATVAGIATIFLLAWPFFPTNPFLGLIQEIIKMGRFYSYTSVFAFNVWSFVGYWRPDTITFLNISFSTWGVILLFSGLATALFLFRKKLDQKYNYYLLFAIAALCFFLFPTKVHERYLFPFFAFLLTAVGLTKSRKLWGIYIISSVASFLNLYYPYIYYNENLLKSELLYKLAGILGKPIGLFFLISFFILIFKDKIPKLTFVDSFIKLIAVKIQNLKKKGKLISDKLPKISFSTKISRYFLIGILAFSLITRLIGLGSPKNEYFDEVYHVFTARQMLHGNKAAWEWWNTPPEGFAYEWTHPPVAKLAMWFSMSIFGENAFAWRLPGVLLGVGCGFLVYLIAKTLFKDELVGILAAGLFSLDGLVLTMSRIGMNDTYMLFFVLLTIYLFLKENNFFSAIAFGLALASKWSALYVAPILFVIWLLRKKKFTWSLLWFAVLPLLVYLATYIPMFLSGHSLEVFWEMQKQMWWYHTGLKATHPYTSQAWSWPFMIRPVYLYTSDEVGGWVSRIYNIGNPIVFWFGLVSIIISLIYSFMERNKILSLVVFSYLIFFLPWIASPRIMFFYHYLPSLPFLAIATGYILRREKAFILPILSLAFLAFLYFYPHWTGIKIPLWWDTSYYWFGSWR